MNVALYGPRGNQWAMTERGRGSLAREQSAISIGPSVMRWEGDALCLDINEWTAPIPSRLRGKLIVRPQGLTEEAFALDNGALHFWRPLATRARIEVYFDQPQLRWQGNAYVDSNWGEEPLERAFRAWDWSRAHTKNDAIVYYDVQARDGGTRALALQFDRNGVARAIDAPAALALPRTRWGLRRTTRGDTPRLVRSMEDGPFYARAALIDRIDGAQAHIVHESLSLDRFSNPIVRAMLPFRMPRLIGRG